MCSANIYTCMCVCLYNLQLNPVNITPLNIHIRLLCTPSNCSSLLSSSLNASVNISQKFGSQRCEINQIQLCMYNVKLMQAYLQYYYAICYLCKLIIIHVNACTIICTCAHKIQSTLSYITLQLCPHLFFVRFFTGTDWRMVTREIWLYILLNFQLLTFNFHQIVEKAV